MKHLLKHFQESVNSDISNTSLWNLQWLLVLTSFGCHILLMDVKFKWRQLLAWHCYFFYAVLVTFDSYTTLWWPDSFPLVIPSGNKRVGFLCFSGTITQQAHLSKKRCAYIFIISCRCCCGQLIRFLRNWRTLRGSSTRLFTRWGHTWTVTDTQSVSWTWQSRRWVFTCVLCIFLLAVIDQGVMQAGKSYWGSKSASQPSAAVPTLLGIFLLRKD